MGFLSRAAEFLLGKATTTDKDGWFFDWLKGGAKTASGVTVTPESAMRLSAVWACVRVRSEDIAKLPLLLYRRQSDGGKERAEKHPLYRLIKEQPNPRMTAFEFRQLMQAQLDLRGNAYAEKEIDGRGRVVALWPLDPTRMTVLRVPDTEEIFYRYRREKGGDVTVPQEAILHLRGATLDGFIGLSPIAYHRETIGLAIAARDFGAEFFGNNAQPLGGLKVPTPISSEAANKLRESWKERHVGKREIAIFDGGLDWVQTGMDNSDAQYMELRQFQNGEIYRIYRVPPHKVGDLEKATFSNIEQQALEYVTDCLLSEMVRWEQTLKRDLLTTAEQAEYFFEFMPDALLRGDLKSRYDAYAIARNWGILSANDIRDRENLNRIPKGDIYLQPLNMVEAGTPPEPKTPTDPAALPPDSAKALTALLRYLDTREKRRNA